MLTPDLDDSINANSWQSSFDRHAANFRARGAHALAAPWSTSPGFVDSSSFIYVANLTWGYHRVADRWNAWLRAWPNNIRLINSVQLLTWNTRKTYLKDLEAVGIPVIPTIYIKRVDEVTLASAAAHFAVADLVIKPQISAGSRNVVRVLVGSDAFASAPKSISVNEAVAELDRVASGEPMMIQPFIANIYNEGEISVLVFGGEVSHAVTKTVRRDDYRVQARHGGMCTTLEHPSPEVLKLVRATFAACPEAPVYGRIDMLRNDATGILSVTELELIEPGLYLDHAADGGMAFARAILVAGSDS